MADADGTPVNSDNFYYHVQINGEDRNEAVIAIEKEQQAECLVKNVYEAERKSPVHRREDNGRKAFGRGGIYFRSIRGRHAESGSSKWTKRSYPVSGD